LEGSPLPRSLFNLYRSVKKHLSVLDQSKQNGWKGTSNHVLIHRKTGGECAILLVMSPVTVQTMCLTHKVHWWHGPPTFQSDCKLTVPFFPLCKLWDNHLQLLDLLLCICIIALHFHLWKLETPPDLLCYLWTVFSFVKSLGTVPR
jgi:hypothetical protein